MKYFCSRSLNHRNSSLLNYISNIKKKPEVELNSIIASLLHMNCNRILGIDRALEEKAHLYAEHTLQLANFAQKKTKKLSTISE